MALVVICAVCGKPVRRKPSKPGRYCSHACYWIAKNGSRPWNKGLVGLPSGKKGKKFGPLTAEHRAKISAATKGAKRKRLYPKGERHPMWKGGIGTERHLIMHQKEYKQLVKDVFTRDDYRCQECGLRGGCNHAAHIKSWAEHPLLRFELSNCRTLCRKCHYQETFGYQMPETSLWGLPAPSKRKEG